MLRDWFGQSSRSIQRCVESSLPLLETAANKPSFYPSIASSNVFQRSGIRKILCPEILIETFEYLLDLFYVVLIKPIIVPWNCNPFIILFDSILPTLHFSFIYSHAQWFYYSNGIDDNSLYTSLSFAGREWGGILHGVLISKCCGRDFCPRCQAGDQVVKDFFPWFWPAVWLGIYWQLHRWSVSCWCRGRGWSGTPWWETFWAEIL